MLWACPHLQQHAGGVQRGLGQQLAGEVKVGPGLHLAQRHGGRQCGGLASSSPAVELLHPLHVLLVPVEGAAGGPRLQGAVVCTGHSHRREAEGVDQCDGIVEGLHLVDERQEGSRRGPAGEVKGLEEGGGVSHLDPVQADDVPDLNGRMVHQVLGEDGAPDNLVRLIGDLQGGAVV